MLYSEIKATEKLSKFTLGTVQLGMQYGMANTHGQPSTEEAFQILDTAAEWGVNSLDTAVAYGTSEQVIGEYLKQSKKAFFVTSKFKVEGEDPRKELAQQQDQTWEHLGKVDMYFFHDAKEMCQYGDILREPLEQMREQGRTRMLGASVYEADEVEAFLKHDWMQGIQIPMSILDSRVIERGLLEELEKRGTAVFIRSVFFQGLLCMDHVPEKYEFLTPYVEELRDIAKTENMTLQEMSVAYIRDLPGITSLVLGCDTWEQVRDNAKLLSIPALSQGAVDGIRAVGKKVPIAEAMDRILGKKS